MSRWIALLVLTILTLGIETPTAVAKVGEAAAVVRDVYGRDLNRRMRKGEALQFGQRVRVGQESAAKLHFEDDSLLSLGPGSEIKITEFIYNPNRSFTKSSMRLVRGLLRFASKSGTRDLKIKTNHGTLAVRGTVFDLMANSSNVEIAVHEGQVEFADRHGTHKVSAGEVLRADGTATETSDRPSSHFALAQTAMVTLLASAEKPARTKKASTGANQTSKATNVTLQMAPRTQAALPVSIAALNPENVVLMQLSYGPVYIELLEDLAPRHVARIRQLARSGFYDGQAFDNVKDGFAAQTGGGGGEALAAELSDSSFTRGSLGMFHRRSDPNSADSRFFVSLGDLKHLTGKYTKWGRVIAGMQHIESLQRGEPPQAPDRILQLTVLSDII
ncbi:MAG: hypothetical protein HOL85_18815 [Rhodospirillaceae bacterium]|nr:hypothetical protein [Rhodospirillaceae bacterium]